MTRYARFTTVLGPVFATADDRAVTGIYFEGQRHAPEISPGWREDPKHPALAECARQVTGYLAGKRDSFDLPLAPVGTPFQQSVWKQIARIPRGKTLTYAELARLAGRPGAARAAGAATGRNPISVVVPCHRVVGANGGLTGYAGGIPRKVKLLEMEGALAAHAA